MQPTECYLWEPAGYSPVTDRLPHGEERSMTTRSAKKQVTANAGKLSNKQLKLDLAPRLP